MGLPDRWGKKHPKDKSNLQLTAYQRHGTVEFRWIRINFFYKAGIGKPTIVRTSIPSNRKIYGFSDATLLKYSKEWEVEKVLEIEHKLLQHRKHVNQLLEMIRNIKAMLASMEQRESKEMIGANAPGNYQEPDDDTGIIGGGFLK